MVADIISILNAYGNSTVQSIRNNLASTGTNATGKTSQSLRFEVKNEGSKITFASLGSVTVSSTISSISNAVVE